MITISEEQIPECNPEVGPERKTIIVSERIKRSCRPSCRPSNSWAAGRQGIKEGRGRKTPLFSGKERPHARERVFNRGPSGGGVY